MSEWFWKCSDRFPHSPSTVCFFIAFIAEMLGGVTLLQINTLRENRFLSRTLSHHAPPFANKRGQPIEVPRLKLAVSPLLFSIWKAAHTLTGHLASAVMTEANTWSIQNSTNGCGNRLGEESKTTLGQPPFVMFFSHVNARAAGWSAQNIFISTTHVHL